MSLLAPRIFANEIFYIFKHFWRNFQTIPKENPSQPPSILKKIGNDDLEVSSWAPEKGWNRLEPNLGCMVDAGGVQNHIFVVVVRQVWTGVLSWSKTKGVLFDFLRSLRTSSSSEEYIDHSSSTLSQESRLWWSLFGPKTHKAWTHVHERFNCEFFELQIQRVTATRLTRACFRENKDWEASRLL